VAGSAETAVQELLTAEQGKRLLAALDRSSLRGKRNYAILGHADRVWTSTGRTAGPAGRRHRIARRALGGLFRSINKRGHVWGNGITAKVLWEVVCDAATSAGIAKLAPHDLRRTCARLHHLAGGELDQIQFLLGHVSIQTTERYLGCKQKLQQAVNDRLGIEPD
jgi:integrase